jgi:hypothetical protein
MVMREPFRLGKTILNGKFSAQVPSPSITFSQTASWSQPAKRITLRRQWDLKCGMSRIYASIMRSPCVIGCAVEERQDEVVQLVSEPCTDLAIVHELLRARF